MIRNTIPNSNSTKESSAESVPEVARFPNPSFSEMLGTDVVQIIVGEDRFKTTFTIHKKLLTMKSKLFAAMFNSHFVEAATSSASFPEDDPETFEVLMEWMYYDSLRVLSLNPNYTREVGRANIALIISVLGMADKYGIDELADRCMTILSYRARSHASCKLDMHMILSIYEKTGPLCKARKFAARVLAMVSLTSIPTSTAVFTAQTIAEAFYQNKDLWDDYFRASRDSISGAGMAFSICEYHLHPKATICLYLGMDGVPVERLAFFR